MLRSIALRPAHAGAAGAAFVLLVLGSLAPELRDPLAASQDRPSRVIWVWSGAVTSRSAVVKARLDSTGADARLLLSRKEDLADAIASPDVPVQADSLGIAAFELEDLQPGTQYYYAVETGGRRYQSGKFRTFADGPMSFRIVAASCASTGSNSSVFTTIESLDPDLFIHMGDLHYENIRSTDPERFMRAYDRVLGSRTQSSLYRDVPIAYMWDDHDFGPNDSDRTSPSRDVSRRVYRDVVPHYPLPADTTINQAFTIGRVRFILTDNRSERMPVDAPGTDRTMLGEEQLQWLLRELEAAAARFPLVVWVNSVPWITREGDREDGWEPFAHERAVIATHIRRLGLNSRLIMLSGDAHMTAMDDGTNSNYASDAPPGERGFVVVHGGPLDRWTTFKGGPYSERASLKRGQFALLDFRDDGQRITTSMSGRSKDGARIIEGIQLETTCDGTACSTRRPGSAPSGSEPTSPHSGGASQDPRRGLHRDAR